MTHACTVAERLHPPLALLCGWESRLLGMREWLFGGLRGEPSTGTRPRRALVMREGNDRVEFLGVRWIAAFMRLQAVLAAPASRRIIALPAGVASCGRVRVWPLLAFKFIQPGS